MKKSGRKPKTLIGYHQADQYMHLGNPRRRDNVADSLFEKVMVKHLPNVRKEMDISF